MERLSAFTTFAYFAYAGKVLASYSKARENVDRVRERLSELVLFRSIFGRDLGKNILIFLAFLHFGIAAGIAPMRAEKNHTLSREELLADLDETYNLLAKHHPNLTAHKSRKELKTIYNKLSKAVGVMNTREDAYLILAELMASVCDEHTQVHYTSSDTPESSETSWPWYKYPLVLAKGTLFIEPPGSFERLEVFDIEGIPGSSLARELLKRTPLDGCDKDDFVSVVSSFGINTKIIEALIGKKRSYKVIARSHGLNRVTTFRVGGATAGETGIHERRFYQRLRDTLSKRLAREGFERRDQRSELILANIGYSFSQKRNLAYLDLRAFKWFETAEEGIDLVMRDVIKRKPDALIIDLVRNSGGSTRTAQYVLAHLLPRSHRLVSQAYVRNVSKSMPNNFEYFGEIEKKRRQYDVKFFRNVGPKGGIRKATVNRRSFGKPDYKGPIYILISPHSASSSLRFVETLRRLRNATVIGSFSATNTVTHCASADGSFKLKHSGFHLHIPSLCFRNKENKFNEQETLVPDIEITPLQMRFVTYNAALFERALAEHRKSKAAEN